MKRTSSRATTPVKFINPAEGKGICKVFTPLPPKNSRVGIEFAKKNISAYDNVRALPKTDSMPSDSLIKRRSRTRSPFRHFKMVEKNNLQKANSSKNFEEPSTSKKLREYAKSKYISNYKIVQNISNPWSESPLQRNLEQRNLNENKRNKERSKKIPSPKSSLKKANKNDSSFEDKDDSFKLTIESYSRLSKRM